MDTSDSYWRDRYLDRGMDSAGSDGMKTVTTGGRADRNPFDSLEHIRLSPSATASFNSDYFVTPRIFTTNEPSPSFGYGDVGVAEPEISSRTYAPTDFNTKPSSSTSTSTSSFFNTSPQASTSTSAFSSQARASTSQGSPLKPSTNNGTDSPIYTPYGSSVLSVNVSAAAPAPSPIPMASSIPPRSAFTPAVLGLPVPPASSTNFAGLYSSSGFDIMGVLARVAIRPNPTIQIGPVDTSCSFSVVDARKHDTPIVFCSDSFSRLTGYRLDEIIGRNCRFLQSPEGHVDQGTPRKYTDSHAAWHMRQHIAAGLESQSSLINYHKEGKAFINLVTIIPITWDSDEIAYYVGFQVDLVEQPNAILDRMRDGSYIVNYSLVNGPPPSVSLLNLESATIQDDLDGGWDEKPTLSMDVDAAAKDISYMALIEAVETKGFSSLTNEDERKAWNKLILDSNIDFVHVLSLKGSILYCSPSVKKILEYEPNELIGKTIQSICHPSDIVPVMRELKDSGGLVRSTVSLLYRIQRKHSGYIWMEATGKLHIEPGKGRKSVILVGRPRDVYRIAWPELREVGGLGETEFWAKLSLEGMMLYSTPDVQVVLGFMPGDLLGTSIYQLTKPESEVEIQQALEDANGGRSTTVKLMLQGCRGFVEVVIRFYALQDVPRSLGVSTNPYPHSGIVAQINVTSSHDNKSRGTFYEVAPTFSSFDTGPPSPMSDDSLSSNSASIQTFRTLAHPSMSTDNVFDELDTTRSTSWQYELHQLQILNKKLRDEKDYLVNQSRKRQSEKNSSERSSTRGKKACANCGSTDSSEWRGGPTGNQTLCNPCGLRLSKSQTQSPSIWVCEGQTTGSAAGSGSTPNANGSGSTSNSNSGSRSDSNSLSPVTWR